jgi:hypothetical protein
MSHAQSHVPDVFEVDPTIWMSATTPVLSLLQVFQGIVEKGCPGSGLLLL